MHVPGWHEATKQLQQDGKFQMIGIIQEQHPDRCRLFMQWKQMGWPIIVDSLNLTGVSGVPQTLAIDEHGIVRLTRARPETIEEEFLNPSYEKPENLPSQPSSSSPPDLKQLKAGTSHGTGDAWRAYGDGLYLWGGDDRLLEAIAAYQQAIRLNPEDADAHFRLGVSYRRRYDSDLRQSDDFQTAVNHWGHALDLDPNQYIWRRRIQQFGPRLAKPYPFYDWVSTARREISARGETPSALVTEPGGAEIASPQKVFEAGTNGKAEPDPRGRIYRDKRGFVHAETAVVPSTAEPGKPVRIHVTFRPNTEIKAHWNNEADDLVFWVNPPEGWAADSPRHTVANPPQAVSLETRKVEFEIRSPESFRGETIQIPAYALYYVCEDVNGTCLYRRQDVDIAIATRR